MPRRTLPLALEDERHTFVDRQVDEGSWRPLTVPPEITGPRRPIDIFLATPRGDLVKWAWHGDQQTFCPPTWADLAIGSGVCGLGCRWYFLMLTHRAMRDPLRPLVYENVKDFEQATRAWLRARRWRVEGKAWRPRTSKDALGLGIDCADSLLLEGLTGHARRLIPLFTDPSVNTLWREDEPR